MNNKRLIFPFFSQKFFKSFSLILELISLVLRRKLHYLYNNFFVNLSSIISLLLFYYLYCHLNLKNQKENLKIFLFCSKIKILIMHYFISCTSYIRNSFSKSIKIRFC